MMAPAIKRGPSTDMSPPRPLLDCTEYVKKSLALTQESIVISSTKVYYAKQYNKYKDRKKQTTELTLSLTYLHFVHWLNKRGAENVNSHLTRKEFQVITVSMGMFVNMYCVPLILVLSSIVHLCLLVCVNVYQRHLCLTRTTMTIYLCCSVCLFMCCTLSYIFLYILIILLNINF
jgi:hypothetical protein